jgi:hypothetical protein
MKVNDLIKIIGSISMVIVLIFGISLATVFKKIKKIIDSPEQIYILTYNDSIQEHDIHDLIHAQEFTWDLLRLMTDNHDSTIIRQITDENGVDHDVDVRETAEGVQLAFVFDYFVVFQIRKDNSDHRQFILVHDYQTGENEKYFIE